MPDHEPVPDDLDDLDDLEGLARALTQVGRAVRDAVRGEVLAADGEVVRTEGGDDVYGIDERAEHALFAALSDLVGPRWPGELVLEGFDAPQRVGEGGPWRYLVDPVDGTRPYLAGLRSAWVLLGAGREARTLEDLEIGVAVEIPTPRARLARSAWGTVAGAVVAVDEDLTGGPSADVALVPSVRTDPERTFVTVVRLLAGDHGPIGAWADRHLAGLEVYDDSHPCSANHLMGVASGASSAVLDPRPLFNPAGLHTHPYDLAALVLYRSAGVIVEALPSGPLDVPLVPDASVAWAAYANEGVAARLRPDGADLPPPAS